MDTRTRILALRGIVYSLLFAWLIKIRFFIAADLVYRYRPLRDEFFPVALQNAQVAEVAYALPVTLALIALLRFSLTPLRITLAAFCLGSCILLVHQGTYNDATFVTSLWVSAIGLWLDHASRDETVPVAPRLAFLTQLLIGMLFLGGLVGKLTSGYFDGSIFYEIYFFDRDHLTYNALRQHLTPTALHHVAIVYSWLVLVLEACLATLPLWPAKPALTAALAALAALAVLNNLLLASVVGSLFGLAAVSLWVIRTQALQQQRESAVFPHSHTAQT